MLGKGSGALGAAAVVVILLAAAFYIQQGRNAERATEQVSATLASPESTEVTAETPVVDAEAATEPEEEVLEDTTPEVMASAPAFDEVRRETDGMTVIAGTGAPGATISVLQDGVEIATSTVDRSGKFATLALIPPDGRGHSLTLSQLIGEDAQESAGEVLLAPLAAPKEMVAAVEDTTAGEKASSDTAASVDIATADLPADDAAETKAPEERVSVAEDAGSDETQKVASTDAAEETNSAPLVQDSVASAEGSAPVSDRSGAVADVVASAAPDTTAPQKPLAPAVLRSTAEGVELLNPSAPEAMDNVALDTISYSEEGEVQLAGRAQSEASTVRVYLNNNAIVDLPVDAQGRWRGDLPDVDEGIYTLRVDEVRADGKVSSRVETPFKRESRDALNAASAAEQGPVKAITVQKGATLWAIARDRYGEGELYVKVFEANKDAIRDPDLIYPGQIFELPTD